MTQTEVLDLMSELGALYEGHFLLSSGLSVAVYPVQMSIEMPGAVSDWFSESLSTRRRLQEECRRLEMSCINASLPAAGVPAIRLSSVIRSVLVSITIVFTAPRRRAV